jgi:hypothetical protein
MSGLVNISLTISRSSQAGNKASVKQLHAVENLFLGQRWIADRGQLYALVVDQVEDFILLQPAIGDGPLVVTGSQVFEFIGTLGDTIIVA